MTLGTVSARYAARSLGRSVRRTALSVVGIGFGVGIALFGIAWIQGESSMTARAAAGGGIGHVRVAPNGFLRTRDDDLRLENGPELLAKVREVSGVELATPHARTGGLLALGTRSVRVELTGVDARTEQQNGRFVRDLAEGRYLEPGERGAVVLGRTLVERLDARLEDELVVTAVDESGDMQSELLVLVGIAESGSRQIDSTIAHTSLEDVATLTRRAEIGEITVLASDVDAVDELNAAIERAVGDDAEVLSWKEVAPALVAGVATDAAFMNVATLMVFLVVLLGVASAQLTAVLERRKELAVLGALGMGSWSLVRVMLVEGLFLGGLGAAAALAWAAPLIGHLAKAGVDLSSAFGEEQNMALAGVILDPIFYPEFGGWLFPTGLALSLLATMVASLYPAVFAARLDPATALRVDR
jgi:ABC-type lipoprotein release transport system permease subunit